MTAGRPGASDWTGAEAGAAPPIRPGLSACRAIVSAAVSSRSTVAPPYAKRPVPHPRAPAPGSALASHYGNCFGCGERHPTGLHMHLTVGEGVAVTGQFDVTADHQGAPGLAHGGLLAAAFDEAMSAVMWLLREPAVTVRLETDFAAPVPVGTRLFIAAECTGIAGRRVYMKAAGRMGAANGPLAVRASALFVQVPLDHFTRNGRAEDIAALSTDPALHRTDEAFEVNP